MFEGYRDETFEALELIAAFLPSGIRGFYQVLLSGLKAGVSHFVELKAKQSEPSARAALMVSNIHDLAMLEALLDSDDDVKDES